MPGSCGGGTSTRRGRTLPDYQPVRHPERIEACWDQLIDESELEARELEIEAFNAGSDHIKRGLAITPVKFGISFNLTAFNQGGALVLVYKDGSVLVTHGGTEMGQGLHQKMLQVAATTLGVPLSTVRLAPTRTDKVPNTSATAASSGSDLNGGAVKNACDQILDRLRQVAAGILGAPAHEVDISRGIVSALSSPKTVTWEELINTAYFQRIQLSASGFYRTEGLHWNLSQMRGEPFKYFAYGAAVSEVEVNRFDGSYTLHRVDIVHDVGISVPAHRPRTDRRRLRPGGRLADPGRPALGRIRPTQPRALGHPGGEHVQDPELLRGAGGLQRLPAGQSP